MAINHLQDVARFPAARQATPEARGLIGRALDRLQHAWCGLHGHDSLLHFEHDRMFLRCTSCGFESRGWEVGETPSQARVRQEHEPSRVGRRTPFVGARKIA